MSEQYRSAAQQRILKVLLILDDHEVDGLAPQQIADSLGIKPSQVTHDLANLHLAGLAEQMESKRWRLTPRIPQIAVAMLGNLDRKQRKLAEIEQRYTRLSAPACAEHADRCGHAQAEERT